MQQGNGGVVAGSGYAVSLLLCGRDAVLKLERHYCCGTTQLTAALLNTACLPPMLSWLANYLLSQHSLLANTDSDQHASSGRLLCQAVVVQLPQTTDLHLLQLNQ